MSCQAPWCTQSGNLREGQEETATGMDGDLSPCCFWFVLYGTKSQSMTTAWPSTAPGKLWLLLRHRPPAVSCPCKAEHSWNEVGRSTFGLRRHEHKCRSGSQGCNGTEHQSNFLTLCPEHPSHSLLCPDPHTPRVPQPALPPLLPEQQSSSA